MNHRKHHQQVVEERQQVVVERQQEAEVVCSRAELEQVVFLVRVLVAVVVVALQPEED